MVIVVLSESTTQLPSLSPCAAELRPSLVAESLALASVVKGGEKLPAISAVTELDSVWM